MAAESYKHQGIYVPLAFAAADVLFELEEGGRITFAVGAAMSLLGRPARLLTELTLTDLMVPSEHGRLARMLEAMARGERVRGAIFAIQRPDRDATQAALSGYAHPEKPGFLVAVLAHAPDVAPDKHDTPSGLLDKEAFAAKVGRLMKSSEGEQYRMTLLDVPEMEQVRSRLGAEGAEAFVGRLGERLRALSVDGDAAGQLTDGRFGVIHGMDVAEDAVARAISLADPGMEIAAHATSMVLDVTEVSAVDATRALAYTLNAFAKEGFDAVDFQKELQPRLSATVRQMKEVRGVIDAGAFDLVFQPVVDLWNNVVHHFEVLVRFGDGTRSPYETVTFAEDTGLVSDLDLAVLDRTVAIMRSKVGSHAELRFAVNLSGRSLGDPAVAHNLREVLRGTRDLKNRLLFELTESYAVNDLDAVNAVIQDIRGMGHPVCLDDFGAGSAAFHYLRKLKVDHVKIDGSYVKDCMQSNEDVAFIEAMVGLCSKLNITTIAEYVEDEQTANLLKLLKVRFGQGYLFGKPFSVRSDRPQDWQQPRIEWRRGLLTFKG